MKRIESKAVIYADIQKVWEAMVHTTQYPDWNPFIVHIDTPKDPPTEGTEMVFTVKWTNGSTRKTKEVVDVFATPQKNDSTYRAEWSYYFKSFLSTIGMVRATRKQILFSPKEGVTHYHTLEDFRGWGIAFLPEADVKEGFERQTQALKAYCES